MYEELRQRRGDHVTVCSMLSISIGHLMGITKVMNEIIRGNIVSWQNE